MSRPVRRRLAKALQPSTAGWLETTAVLRLPPADTPRWTPDPSYMEAMTATVWVRRTGRCDAHAVVLTYCGDGAQVLSRGIVAAEDAVRLGGLTDKPHRISWLGRDVTTEPICADHPAARYHDWVWATADHLDGLYRRLLRRRHLHSQQVRLRATPAGHFQATVAIEIEAGAYQRFDLTAHAAALSGLLRHLGRGARLRFHPRQHPAIDPLDAQAYRDLTS